MNVDWIRDLCLSFPHATEQIQWGDNLVFKVAGKIHAIAALRPAKTWLCFKVSPEKFPELTERPGIIPAPYLARAKWVALEAKDALSPDELAHLVARVLRHGGCQAPQENPRSPGKRQAFDATQPPQKHRIEKNSPNTPPQKQKALSV